MAREPLERPKAEAWQKEVVEATGGGSDTSTGWNGLIIVHILKYFHAGEQRATAQASHLPSPGLPCPPRSSSRGITSGTAGGL